jgi:ABC-type amino acid transport substrate-binding protein
MILKRLLRGNLLAFDVRGHANESMFLKLSILVLIFAGVPCRSFSSPMKVVHASLIEFRPMSWTEDHEVKGSYVDFLKAIEEKSGLTIKIETLPFLRAIDKVRMGEADFTMAPLAADGSGLPGKKLFLYKHRYFLLSRKSDPMCSLKEVRGDIGRLRGGCADLLDEKKVTFFDVTSSYEQALAMLHRGRLKGFCGVEEGLSFQLKTMNLETNDLTKFMIAERDLVFQFSKNFDKATFNKIEAAVEELLKEGELKRIQQKYNEPSGFLRKPDCKPASRA